MDSDFPVRFAECVEKAGRIAVLSGAGISTPSDLPDFRSPGGLYATTHEGNVFELDAFLRTPEHFYRFAQAFYPRVRRAQPNVAHRVLAAWERRGKEVHIATQNIDDLHERAGSTRVYHVHGNLQTSTCLICGQQCPTHSLEAEITEGRVPYCACGGVMKPDITFFGEPLPEEAWNLSTEAMARADLVIVVGTSLVVYPAASLPNYRREDADLVVINREPTHLDRMADLVSHDEITEVFTATAALLHDPVG